MFIIIFLIFILSSPICVFANGNREFSSWENIEISDNFIWYNVLYSQNGEKAGLEETNIPMYGQNVVITYEAGENYNGKSFRLYIFDSNMESILYRSGIIENGKMTADVILLSHVENLINLESENDLQYFCLLVLAESRIVRSRYVNTNITFNVYLGGRFQYPFKENDYDDFYFVLESECGEYRQVRTLYNDGIVQADSVLFMFTDLLPNKTYRLINNFSTILLNGVNILLFIDAYNFEEYYENNKDIDKN